MIKTFADFESQSELCCWSVKLCQPKIKMNKYLIVLMAICLVSVHAHVRRDAPATDPANQNFLSDLQKQFEEFSKTVSDKVKVTLNPDELKKNINELSANINKAIDDLKEKNKAS